MSRQCCIKDCDFTRYIKIYQKNIVYNADSKYRNNKYKLEYIYI